MLYISCQFYFFSSLRLCFSVLHVEKKHVWKKERKDSVKSERRKRLE